MRRPLIGLSLVVLVAAGCAEPGARPAGDGAARPSAPAPTTPPVPVQGMGIQADVTAVRKASDPRSVTLTLALLAGDEGCSQSPRIGYYTEENDTIYANVVQDSLRPAEVGVCVERTPGVVTLTSRTPIGSRVLMLNNDTWMLPPSATDYRRCAGTLDCDPAR